MVTKRIIFIYLLALLLIFSNLKSYSQEFFTKELFWVSQDSIETLIFDNTNQIIEWGKSINSFAAVHSEEFRIKNSDIFILIGDICSGISCPSIYIFAKRNKRWQLNTKSKGRIKEQMEVSVDKKLEKIIFKTKTGQIGELPFEMLNLSLDKEMNKETQ